MKMMFNVQPFDERCVSFDLLIIVGYQKSQKVWQRWLLIRVSSEQSSLIHGSFRFPECHRD